MSTISITLPSPKTPVRNNSAASRGTLTIHYGARQNAVLAGRKFTSRFIEPGIISYEDTGAGVELLRKETIERALAGMIGRPLIINHAEVTASNRATLEKGIVTGTGYDTASGWFFCNGEIADDDARQRIESGCSVSCAFDVLSTGPGGTWHGIHYARELTAITFTHLAIVENPRFEGATIRLNSKQKQQPVKNTMSLLKWIQKKIGADQGVEGRISPETKVRINGKTEVALSDLVASYRKNNTPPPEGDDDKNNEVSPDSEVEVDGKMVKINDLIAAHRKANNIPDDEGEGRANEDDEEKAAKEKAEKEAAEKKAAEERANAAAAAGSADFISIHTARANGTASTAAAKPPETIQVKLARGQARYGSGKN